MLLQKHLSWKLLSTVAASVRLQTKMNSYVHIESDSLVERFRTIRTKIFFLVSVNEAIGWWGIKSKFTFHLTCEFLSGCLDILCRWKSFRTRDSWRQILSFHDELTYGTWNCAIVRTSCCTNCTRILAWHDISHEPEQWIIFLVFALFSLESQLTSNISLLSNVFEQMEHLVMELVAADDGISLKFKLLHETSLSHDSCTLLFGSNLSSVIEARFEVTAAADG